MVYIRACFVLSGLRQSLLHGLHTANVRTEDKQNFLKLCPENMRINARPNIRLIVDAHLINFCDRLVTGSNVVLADSTFACNRLLLVAGASMGGNVIIRPPRIIWIGSLSSFVNFFTGSLDTLAVITGMADTTVAVLVMVVVTIAVTVAVANDLVASCPDVNKEGMSILFEVNDSGVTPPPCSTSAPCNIKAHNTETN